MALLAGEINTIFAPLIEVLPHIRAGTIKALAVGGKRRSPLLPALPTVGDLLPGYETSSWGGISAPAGTPVAIVNKLSAAVVKSLTLPAVKAHMADADKEPVGSSPAEFRQFILQDIERLRMQVKISGAKVD
jgi:tripartite-type tricarboxylate transporter receptor subunit TctC